MIRTLLSRSYQQIPRVWQNPALSSGPLPNNISYLPRDRLFLLNHTLLFTFSEEHSCVSFIQ